MNEDLEIFTDEEKLLWSVMESYRHKIDVKRLNLHNDDWKKIIAIYNSHQDITKKTRKQTKRTWNRIQRYKGTDLIFTDEENLLRTLIENYRNEIDASHMNLNKADWQKVTDIYNSHGDIISFRNTRKRTTWMWYGMVKR